MFLSLNKDEITEMFIHQATKYKASINTDVIVSKPPSQDDDDSPNNFIKHQPLTTTAAEVRAYVAAAPELERHNLLEFCSLNKTIFPILTQMARAYLAVPSTSCPTKQCFSAAGRAMSNHCASMRSETLEALVCLKSWGLSLTAFYEHLQQITQWKFLLLLLMFYHVFFLYQFFHVIYPV